MSFCRLDHLKQSISKKRRLAARDAQLRSFLRHERNGFQDLVNQIAVINLAWRLRAHEATAVTPLGKEEDVVRRVTAIDNANVSGALVDSHDVARAKVRQSFRQ